MRKADSDKQMAAKTINFEKWVLSRLETMATRENASVSKLVNMMMRKVVMTDQVYAAHRAKEAYIEFQRWQYTKEQLELNSGSEIADLAFDIKKL